MFLFILLTSQHDSFYKNEAVYLLKSPHFVNVSIYFTHKSAWFFYKNQVVY